MEELEKNETSTQAEENTVSLASAQALADALAKIEAYTPTTWVDNSSPDIDAEHLNKPEQAIKRVTDALNSAVDVIKDLQSQVTKNAGDISTVNNNLSKAIARLVGNIKIGGLESRSTTEIYSSLPDGSLYFFYCDGSQGISTELGFTDVNNASCGFIYKSASWRGSGILVPMTGVGTDYNMFVGRLNGENQLKWVGVK